MLLLSMRSCELIDDQNRSSNFLHARFFHSRVRRNGYWCGGAMVSLAFARAADLTCKPWWKNDQGVRYERLVPIDNGWQLYGCDRSWNSDYIGTTCNWFWLTWARNAQHRPATPTIRCCIHPWYTGCDRADEIHPEQCAAAQLTRGFRAVTCPVISGSLVFWVSKGLCSLLDLLWPRCESCLASNYGFLHTARLVWRRRRPKRGAGFKLVLKQGLEQRNTRWIRNLSTHILAPRKLGKGFSTVLSFLEATMTKEGDSLFGSTTFNSDHSRGHLAARRLHCTGNCVIEPTNLCLAQGILRTHVTYMFPQFHVVRL